MFVVVHSPMEILRKVDALSRPERCLGFLIPLLCLCQTSEDGPGTVQGASQRVASWVDDGIAAGIYDM